MITSRRTMLGMLVFNSGRQNYSKGYTFEQ